MNDILITLSCSIIAFILGSALLYLKLRRRLIVVQRLDQEVKSQNEQLYQEAARLQKKIASYESDENYMQQKLSLLEHSIGRADKQAKEAADLFYQQHMSVAMEHLDKSLSEESEKYQRAILSFQNELQQVMEDSTKELSFTIEKQRNESSELEKQLADLRAKTVAAVEANKRIEAIKNENKFYRIQLSEIDIEEIKVLRSITPYLRDKEPLNKVIWKVYYEKPTSDMIGRVIGSGTHTGIYKITDIESGKCYVGQAVNLSDRWKQHIKRGIGADTPTRNKLYPAMLELGPENFTFEVIEECDRSLLDAREDYWQDYFKAKEFGYSIK